MIEFESKHQEFKFEFKIEPLPDGTFVGRSENPKLEIKGASPQEIQRKIQEMVGSGILKRLLGVDMTTAMTGKGIEVTMERAGDAEQQKLSLNAMFRLGSPSEAPKLGATDAQMTSPEAFDASSVRAQKLLFWVVVLALVGAVVWWFLR
ncbi:MAG TPA: hypothetical protein VLA96_04945 [Terriglobales bacterium]|nr:hypothetical protein [Terriglobales bacterium]